MSNVIQFLETMGRNPSMTRVSTVDYAASVALLEIHNEQRHALLHRDQDVLSGLLGGRSKMLCSVFPADDDQKDDQKHDNEREPEEPNRDTPAESE